MVPRNYKMGDLLPFDFFRQETSNSDVVVRTEAMSKVTLICALMGADKTRLEMIPYLLTRVGDMDQVLLKMAAKVGNFIPFIGGPEYAHSLVQLVEALCNIEEVTVRTTASSSICKILSQLRPSDSVSVQAFLELFQRLSNEDLGEIFYGRVSACQIIAELYRVVSNVDRTLVTEIFGKLVLDDLSMVRRAASTAFIKLCSYADSEIISSEFLLIMKATANDEYSTVKVIAIENLHSFIKLLKNHNISQTIISEFLIIIKSAVEDHSWRVRQAIVKNYNTFSTCFTAAELTSDLFPGIITLMQDVEPDIRILALQNITSFANSISTSIFLSEFIPIASQLIDDPISNVRKVLTEISLDIIPSLVNGGVESLTTLSDLIIKLIGDDDPLVRLRVIRKLHIIAKELPALCQKLVEPLKIMFKDTNWRIRKQIASCMNYIVKHLTAEYFCEHYINDFLALLKDGVGEVRNETALTIPLLISSCTAPWFQDRLFPSIRAMANDEFCVRLCMLNALQGIITCNGIQEKIHMEALALIIGTTNDRVPNIRLKAAQVLGPACISIGAENCKGTILPVLTELLNDKDKDVKYFANFSMKSFQ